ncbi:MAG TPA: hypothetical protein K8U92_07400 [Aliarcobacter thereius]|nr:hypothetical protein [Aliarcobacter thereius]HJE03687.1 hypothetical protein [Aliarcobacter thereius]
MNNILSEINKIKDKFKFMEKLESELNELRELKTKWFLNEEEKRTINSKIDEIQNQLGIPSNPIEYSITDIKNANSKEMLIEKLLGRGSITLFIGHTGCGKTKIAHYIFKSILELRDDIYVRYLDMDNPVESLNSFKIDIYKENYGGRFKYYGKRNHNLDLNMVNEAENVIISIVEEQLAHPERIYVLVEDNLKNIARKNKKGFIDTNYLWRLEKKFQAVGGTTIVLHHFNKAGIYADTSDILNFCDAAFNVSFNENSSSIIIEPEKQSRYELEPKAFLVDKETREIVSEIPYISAKMSVEETKIVRLIKDLLIDCGEFNQSELEKELKLARTSLGMGEKKLRTILKKYTGSLWDNYRGENNALIFTIKVDDMQNLQNQPNSYFKDI